VAEANFTCGGAITYLGVNSSSSLYVSMGPFGVWLICNLSSTSSNGGTSVTVDSCKAWYAALLTQKALGQSATLYFTSTANSNNGAECTAIGTWTSPSPLPYHMDYQ